MSSSLSLCLKKRKIIYCVTLYYHAILKADVEEQTL